MKKFEDIEGHEASVCHTIVYAYRVGNRVEMAKADVIGFTERGMRVRRHEPTWSGKYEVVLHNPTFCIVGVV